MCPAEEIGFNIPSYKILSDDYHDQSLENDFTIDWNIQFEKAGILEFEQSIQKSKYYNSAIMLGDTLSGNEVWIWARSSKGYKFYGQKENKDFITVDFNKNTGVVKFVYCGT